MAWTELTRRQYDRQGTKYASDTSDAEWSLIAPLMPPPKTTGRPRTTCLRDVIDALLYIATTGCQWRMLPNDFPPISTVLPDSHISSDAPSLVCFLRDVFVEKAKLSGWSCNSTRKPGLGRSPLGFCEPQGS